MRQIRIVDPACGSGVLLVAAFRRLLVERSAIERETARPAWRAEAATTRLAADILAGNLYGVDIDPAAVELTRLALRQPRAGAPPASPGDTIRCGNSLVTPDFWKGRAAAPHLPERVNAFDWRAAFPQVWPDGAGGGFDIVLGNPPFVKLQTLRGADPELAAWLQADRGGDTYESARTGNFDLYLPFIEQGLRLLAPHGRMAYIAPSLWTVNRSGKGLRRLVRAQQSLERWVDLEVVPGVRRRRPPTPRCSSSGGTGADRHPDRHRAERGAADVDMVDATNWRSPTTRSTLTTNG